MITPNDIETKVFSSSLRGYNKREVDEFLDQIMIDYQALLDQNAKMLERVHVLQKQVAEAKDPARMTQDAKRMMNDISASAEQKAEIIIKNAKHDAENIVRNAKNSTSQADEDAERLRRKVEKFKLRFKQMLEEEIDRVDDNSEDLLDDLREDFYPTMLYGEDEKDATKVAGAAAIEEDPIADLPDVEPTGGLEPEDDESADDQNPADDLSEDDQDADNEEDEDAVSDDTMELEEAEEEEETPFDEEAPSDAEESEEPGPYRAGEDEDGSEEGSDEAPEAPEEDDEASEGSDEEEEKEEEEEPEGVPAETIIIDKAVIAKAQAEAAQFEEYDDPDRAEPEEEEKPETEEEQIAKYAADYAGDGEPGVTDDTVVIDDPLLKRAKEANVNVDDLPGFRSSINSNMDDTIVMKKIRNGETVDITESLKEEK